MKKTRILILGIIIGIIATLTIVVYASNTFNSKDISYTNENTEVNNVSDAVDELYGKTKENSRLLSRMQKNMSAINYLKSLSNEVNKDYSSGDKKEMFTFSHPATEQTDELTDYRYIGSMPNNYIKFNNEMWRIIGVFNVDGEERLKIIKDDFIGSMSYNSTNESDWVNSSLNTYFNNDYYNSLTSSSKNKIAKSTYYLGGNSSNEVSTEEFYSFERGTAVYDSRSTHTSNYIGLMYPSDYTYTYANGVDDVCYSSISICNNSTGKEKSWLYKETREWLLNPLIFSPFHAFQILSTGEISGKVGGTVALFEVRPVLYLQTDIKITGGNGSLSNPYTIE